MHTNGPWEYKTFDDGTRRVVHGHISIAKVFGHNLEQEAANARLIAESPALFDALKLVAAIVIDKYDAGDEALNNAWDAAREVLSRLE